MSESLGFCFFRVDQITHDAFETHLVLERNGSFEIALQTSDKLIPLDQRVLKKKKSMSQLDENEKLADRHTVKPKVLAHISCPSGSIKLTCVPDVLSVFGTPSD